MEEVKSRIIEEAIKLFGEKGYHGTSMRDITNAVGCSLPTLYYHYSNKEKLFDEAVAGEFMQLIKRLNGELLLSADPPQIYMQVIKQRKALNQRDKTLMRLAMKVQLGFEDVPITREKLVQWEKARVPENLSLIVKALGVENAAQTDLAIIIVGYLENTLQRVILLDEDVADKDIERQLNMLFKAAIK